MGRPLLLPRKTLAAGTAAFAAAVLATAGCGGGGDAQGATASVYVVRPLCAGAKQQLARDGVEAAGVHLRVRCLGVVERNGTPDLAAIGAGARRASEDSSSIAYLTRREPTAVRFAATILEEAGIALVPAASGAAAMRRVLGAVERAGGGDLREAVREAL